jgi:hypothetical protein
VFALNFMVFPTSSIVAREVKLPRVMANTTNPASRDLLHRNTCCRRCDPHAHHVGASAIRSVSTPAYKMVSLDPSQFQE